MIEFVKVVFNETRDVFVDHVRQGLTGVTLRVARGHHRFDLGEPKNYSPASILEPIMNTTSSNPRILTFAPAVVTAAERGVAAPASPVAGFAVASRNSSMFHTSQACPAAAQITDNNKVFGEEARQGRTLHENCG